MEINGRYPGQVTLKIYRGHYGRSHSPAGFNAHENFFFFLYIHFFVVLVSKLVSAFSSADYV